MDLIFLIEEVPGLLGERSNYSSFLSACLSGGPGQAVPSSDEHHKFQIDHMKWVGEARRLLRVWQCLDRHTQIVLTAYYTPRGDWPEGYADQIGPDLASVALAFPPDGDSKRLQDVCERAGRPKPKLAKVNKKAILNLWSGYREHTDRAKREAWLHVSKAHEEWERIYRMVNPPRKVKGHWTEARARSLAEFQDEVA